MKISSDAIQRLGSKIATKRDDDSLDERTFIAFFGTNPDVISECWEAIKEKLPRGQHPKHILWTCMFMKLYLPEDVMIVMLDTSKPTLRKWVWKVMEAVALMSTDVIQWGKRKRNLPANAIACISVDGTDFKIQEPFPFDRKWMSPKYKGAGLRYEVAISIFSGDIVWLYGPHRASKHDLTIFREKLMGLLEEGEMVEADKGYVGEADWIRSKTDYSTVKERREKGRIRNRTETCNRRFKVWGILKQEYRHDIKKHELVVRSIVVFTQIAIDNGDCLFGCEPTTTKKESYSIDDVDLDA